MSGNSDVGKVVDLQQRQAQQPGTPTERQIDLLKAARSAAMKKLAGLISSMFDGVDDALFDMAEKAENNSMQTRFFDGMREVRKKRPGMERGVQESLSSVFADFVSPNRRQTEAQSDGAGLSLVDESELEETLAVSSMVGKAENRCSRVLFALNQRFSVLSGGAKVSDEDNPVGPKAVIKAFQGTLKDLEGDVRMIKLIILKLYDKHVVSAFDNLYDELNQQLIDAGVLPQLKAQTLPGRRSSSASQSSSAPGDVSGAAESSMLQHEQRMGSLQQQGSIAHGDYAQSPLASAEAALQAEVFNTLRSLLAARHSGYTLGPGQGIQGQMLSPQIAQGPTLAASDLLNALSILQNQVVQPQPGMTYAIPSMQAISQIKGELIHQAVQFGGSDHRVAAADEDTIDLVGMLFEFILQDKNLPAEIQAQLARLQIPYLKVAILDKHLFAKKEHPARRLLDELAQAGVGWSEESDKDRRLYDRIKQIVETLLRDFDDDTGIFEREFRDFVQFFAGLKKRADVAEQRTTEAARGREKLHDARKNAAKEILARMEGKPVPEVIRHVLTRPWANVLVLTILRQGEGSHQWQASLRVADELIWSCQPKYSDDERTRLRALVPELEKALRQGLAMVAYQESDVQHLLIELQKFYSALLDPSSPISLMDDDENSTMLVVEEKARFSPPPAAGIEETSFVDEIVLGAKGEEDVEDEMVDDHYVETARSIRVGAWVEFRDASGHAERAKLSWISPISAKYLFVNRKGLKVGDKTVWGLAAELRTGTAEILEDVPLFDRALDAIVERLKTGAAANQNDRGAPASEGALASTTPAHA